MGEGKYFSLRGVKVAKSLAEFGAERHVRKTPAGRYKFENRRAIEIGEIDN